MIWNCGSTLLFDDGADTSALNCIKSGCGAKSALRNGGVVLDEDGVGVANIVSSTRDWEGGFDIRISFVRSEETVVGVLCGVKIDDLDALSSLVMRGGSEDGDVVVECGGGCID